MRGTSPDSGEVTVRSFFQNIDQFAMRLKIYFNMFVNFTQYVTRVPRTGKSLLHMSPQHKLQGQGYDGSYAHTGQRNVRMNRHGHGTGIGNHHYDGSRYQVHGRDSSCAHTMWMIVCLTSSIAHLNGTAESARGGLLITSSSWFRRWARGGGIVQRVCFGLAWRCASKDHHGIGGGRGVR